MRSRARAVRLRPRLDLRASSRAETIRSIKIVGEQKADILKIGSRTSRAGVRGPCFEVEAVDHVEVDAERILCGRDCGRIEIRKGFSINESAYRTIAK